MTGKILTLVIAISALVVGAAVYYLQVYYYYDEVTPKILLTPLAGGTPEEIPVQDLHAIDADSSPIRFRACFATPLPADALAERFEPYEGPTPLTAPGWFDCFDAEAIGDDLDGGRAQAFLGEANVQYGIDRVIAIEPDGRGFAWHQINSCGETVFNGDPAPDGCPPAPERTE